MTKPIGFIGIGILGQAMAQSLLDQEIPLIVWNRSRQKAEQLKGPCQLAQSPRQAFEVADTVILMLADALAIREVITPSLLDECLEDKTVIQMGTIGPEESVSFEEEFQAGGGAYLEAPVLGSAPQARKKSLMVMVGASPKLFEEHKALLAHFGHWVKHIGPVGQALRLKLAMNQLIAGLTCSYAQSLSFVENTGLDPELFCDLLRQSSLHAATFDKKLAAMQAKDFSQSNFPLKHLAKDLQLYLSEAKSAGLRTEALLGMQAILERALEQGHADEDYASLLMGITPPDGS